MVEAVQEIKIVEVTSKRGLEGYIVPEGYHYIKAPKLDNHIYDAKQSFDKLYEFADYCRKFKKETSSIIRNGDTFDCDFNYHTKDAPAVANDHTAKFTLQIDPDFARWQNQAGKFMGQKEFADFMADYAKDFYAIDKADILNIAKKIKVVSEATMNSDYENGNLDVMFNAKERATFGDKPIPEVFEIALPVYRGFQAYVMPIRVFWVKDGTAVKLKFEFVRLHLITDRALSDAAQDVANMAEIPVFGYGVPGNLPEPTPPVENGGEDSAT